MGVLRSNRNDTFNRMSRAVTRSAHATRKTREKKAQGTELGAINNEIEALSQAKKDGQGRLKELKTRKASLTSKRQSSYRVGSSSSGRVSSRKGKEPLGTGTSQTSAGNGRRQPSIIVSD
jgi:chromosome segregation ATPase